MNSKLRMWQVRLTRNAKKQAAIVPMAFVPMALLVVVSCARDEGQRKIIETVKRDSVAYCSRSKEGCEFTVGKRPDGWGVMVFPIVRSESGERVYIPGVFRSHSYPGL
jgi:hypothetical protein